MNEAEADNHLPKLVYCNEDNTVKAPPIPFRASGINVVWGEVCYGSRHYRSDYGLAVLVGVRTLIMERQSRAVKFNVPVF